MQAKMLKTNCTHKFYPRWSVSHSTFTIRFDHMLTFIRYIQVYFTFGFLDCIRLYNEDFVKPSLRYIEVLFHTLDCSFGGAEENR